MRKDFANPQSGSCCETACGEVHAKVSTRNMSSFSVQALTSYVSGNNMRLGEFFEYFHVFMVFRWLECQPTSTRVVISLLEVDEDSKLVRLACMSVIGSEPAIVSLDYSDRLVRCCDLMDWEGLDLQASPRSRCFVRTRAWRIFPLPQRASATRARRER